jgi:hypothetical protein
LAAILSGFSSGLYFDNVGGTILAVGRGTILLRAALIYMDTG